MSDAFVPEDRAAEKRRSREEDERALEAGEISREELRRKNGHFVFPHVYVDLTDVEAYLPRSRRCPAFPTRTRPRSFVI